MASQSETIHDMVSTLKSMGHEAMTLVSQKLKEEIALRKATECVQRAWEATYLEHSGFDACYSALAPTLLAACRTKAIRMRMDGHITDDGEIEIYDHGVHGFDDDENRLLDLVSTILPVPSTTRHFDYKYVFRQSGIEEFFVSLVKDHML